MSRPQVFFLCAHSSVKSRPALRRAQRGAATLFIVSLLMLLGALAALTSSRAVFFTQKSATGVYHYEQARQAAFAGIDQMVAQLSYTGPATPNRGTYLEANLKLKDDALALTAPLAGTLATYDVTLAQPDASQRSLLEIRSRGCTENCAETGAKVTMTQIVKMRSLVVATPTAALTTREAVSLKGNVSIRAKAPAAAVLAGASIDFGGAASATGRVVQNDPDLQHVTREAFFASFFGDTHAAIRSQVPVLDGRFPNDGTIGGIYWVEGDVAVHGGQYGTPEAPVVVIVNGNLTMNANTRFYGFLYVVNGWDNSGGGNAAIFGAAVSERGFSGTGTPDFHMDNDILSSLSAFGAPAKVPGSWRDF
jgi:Tfp pilus assembly protein PilX